MWVHSLLGEGMRRVGLMTAMLSWMGLSAYPVDVQAQALQDGDTLRGLTRDPGQRLRFIEPDSTTLDLKLPVVDPPGEPSPASVTSFDCNDAVLEGNTVLDAQDVDTVLGRLRGRRISFEDIQAARLDLTGLYLDAGYLTSLVVVPDQDVAEGRLRFRAIEGVLAGVVVRGEAPRFNTDVLLRPLEQLEGVPLKLQDLRRELAMVESDPRVASLSAQLRPTAVGGQSELLVEIEPRPAYSWSVGIDNLRAPSLGGEQGRLGFAHWSLFGYSDVLNLDASIARGVDDVSASYRLPLATTPWSLEAHYTRSDSTVIEEPFDRIDIESESRRYGLGVQRELSRSSRGASALSLGFEVRKSETYLLGLPFSFAPGVDQGRAETDAVRLRYERSRRASGHAWSLRSTLSIGLDVGDATLLPGEPDAKFVSWFSQFQYARALGPNGQLRVDAQVQLSDDALLPLEKFSLGGYASVRGYRQNQLVRDNGYAISLQYQQPFAATDTASAWSWVAFADVGRGWNAKGRAPSPDTLAGAGVGLRWEPDERWFGRLDWAHGFSEFVQGERDLQDRGVHFALAYRWP